MATRVVALLRGINVGRAKRVAMADLRALLADLGFEDVTTVLNSGNALFSCSAMAVSTAAGAIEDGVQDKLGVRCRVVVRTAAAFAASIEQAPLQDLVTDPSRYFVGFLDGRPNAAARAAVSTVDEDPSTAPDRIVLVGREVYLWCPAGLSKSPLTKTDWDTVLGTAVTMRNWKTVTKIAALL